MKNNSVTRSSTNTSTSPTMTDTPSKAQRIGVVTALMFESGLIVSVLTIILFAREKKLRKKSLFLVMNMALADVMLGAVSLPLWVYLLWTAKTNAPISYYYHFLDTTFSHSSLISAVFISCERFYAVYWPLKHKTLSTRAYGIAIFMVWSLAIVVSIVVFTSLYLGSHKAAVLSWMLFLLSFLLIVCACNIGIWRKVRKRNITLQQQNRAASQNQRLTKTLLFVSAISVLSWLPLVIANFLVIVQGLHIPLLFLFSQIITILSFSNSILNPFVYALRIPEIKQTLFSCCSRRQVVINRPCLERKENIAVVLTPGLRLRTLHPDSSQVQQTLEQKTMDTKL